MLKDKEKNLKAAREMSPHLECNPHKITADLSETMEVSKTVIKNCQKNVDKKIVNQEFYVQ